MDRETERYRHLARRTLMLGGLKLALFGGLGARMYYLQVTEGERFRVLADDNRISVRLIAPSRGEVLDRFGVPLAVNIQNFQVVLVPEQAGNVEAVLARLSEIVPLTDHDLRRVQRDMARLRRFMPITVRENLTWDQVAQLEVNAPELPGLSIEVGELRHYPHGYATAHTLGYVGAVSESDLTGDPVLTLPGFRIGKTGAERQLETELRGLAGTSHVEVNAVGRVIRELRREEDTFGREVRMTLDIGLQNYVQTRLAEEHSASAVVMDVHNGEVYALASSPSYDPNLFTAGISSNNWNALLNDQFAPLTNKAISGQYPPGSTFKMVVALAALEEGLIGENHRVFCTGHIELGNHRFHCWKRGGHGRVDLVAALAESCDVFFYDVARRLGIQKLAEVARRMGFGVPVGIDLPGERPGLMPDRDWKQRTMNQPWLPGETLIAGIGQGYVLATPLQIATMTARLVNGGKAVVPRMTLSVGPRPTVDASDLLPQSSFESLGFSDRHLRLIFEGMVQVTTGPRGTARSSRIGVDELEMGGKTGTSQVRRISAAERASGIVRQEDRPWRDRHHALFCGFAPIHAPRYAMAVVVEHGGGGSSTAAPIARDILIETQRRNPAQQQVADAGEVSGDRDETGTLP